ncbi:ABC transporter ATP-binding protein [bacterium]|nr:ABC transporter ATP-binding protein [bacterium]
MTGQDSLNSRGEAIRAAGLGKVFQRGDNRVVALQGVDLIVPAGAFVSVIGPSGCGKTSFLRIVGDLEDPTSGEVLVHGHTPGEARRRREIGFIFQSPALLPWRTVAENVRLPGEIFGDASVSEQAQAVLDAVGLAGFERAYPRELSGGMQSRVSIARALTYHPALLLMDEPFGALDEITRERMQVELLRIWQARQTTVLFITHSLSEAVLLSDRVVVMSARPGRIVADCTVPFPRPRDADLRGDPEFVRMVEGLRGMLEG